MELTEEYRFSHEICLIVFRQHKLETTNGTAEGEYDSQMSAYRYGEKKSLAANSCGSVALKVFNSSRLWHRSGCSHRRWAQVNTGPQEQLPGVMVTAQPLGWTRVPLANTPETSRGPENELQMQTLQLRLFRFCSRAFLSHHGVFIAGKFVQLKEAARLPGPDKERQLWLHTHGSAKAGRSSSRRAESWQSWAGSSSPRFIFLTQWQPLTFPILQAILFPTYLQAEFWTTYSCSSGVGPVICCDEKLPSTDSRGLRRT